MAASAYFDQVQKLYIAYFGRPADPTGLNYWAANIDASGGNFDAAINGFAASTESQALYAAGTTAQLVTSIYTALFNRPPEAAGLAYWTSLIDAGAITGARAAYQILNSAGPGDATAIANKVAAANSFTSNIDTSAELAGYSGASSAAIARAWLAKVDATPYSIANLTSDTTKGVADAAGVQPSVPTAPAGPSFSATLKAGAVAFSGQATGDISVAWDGPVGTSVATFARGGNFSDPITFGGGGATIITLGAADNLIGSASTLAGLTTSGAGAVKLTDTSLNLNGKVFAANSLNDVLTITTSAAANTSLTNLTGFETVHLAGSSDLITIGSGFNTTIDTTAAVIVQLGSGGQTFNGSSGTDTILGGAGNDIIYGGAGDDIINGSDGDDIIYGGAGDDTISSGADFGGAGNDTFVISGVTLATNGLDTIVDFKPGADKIQFSVAAVQAATGASLTAVAAINFLSGPVAATNTEFFIYDKATGNLSFDADGNGNGIAVVLVKLVGEPDLAATDIVLV